MSVSAYYVSTARASESLTLRKHKSCSSPWPRGWPRLCCFPSSSPRWHIGTDQLSVLGIGEIIAVQPDTGGGKVTMPTLSASERQRRLNEASQEYMQGKISVEDFEKAETQYMTDYKMVLHVLAQGFLPHDMSMMERLQAVLRRLIVSKSD